jgi:aspartate kinase
MRIFKFGGASVKDASAVKNVLSILDIYRGEKLVVVISAMGKTTNGLELVHDARFHGKSYREELQKIRQYHTDIAHELFAEQTTLPAALENQFDALNEALTEPCTANYDQEYDKVVGYGELLSTALVFSFLQQQGLSVAWADARQVVRTDSRHRDARVNWDHSKASSNVLLELLEKKDIIIIQGYIGSAPGGVATTLGREGSDFTAAIMAYLLDARDVTIWKDVPGMLNADPKWFSNTVKLDKISFREAIELAYYGASVIHPKTIKPLQNKGIPLYIKSFIHPKQDGTVIQESGDYDNLVPSYIFKPNQVLVSFTPKDFSFVVEDNLREIFEEITRLGIRISLMENSAISFSIVTDKDSYKLDQLFEKMKSRYQVKYNENLTLITIRHWDDKTLEMLTAGKEILLEQKSRQTVRMIVR